MNPELSAKVLDHIRCSHAALDSANASLEKAAQVQKLAAEKIPAIVEAMVAQRRIHESEREKAASALRDPLSALEITLQMADPKNTIDPLPLGTSKQASSGTGKPGRSARDEAYQRTLSGG